MASVVDICNGALNQLGASTILTLTEDSKNARLCNARYTQVRDSLFRSHLWNCLTKRVELAKDTGCDSLQNMNWNEIEAVIVPTNSSFEPSLIFKRGERDKGGIAQNLSVAWANFQFLFHWGAPT